MATASSKGRGGGKTKIAAATKPKKKAMTPAQKYKAGQDVRIMKKSKKKGY